MRRHNHLFAALFLTLVVATNAGYADRFRRAAYAGGYGGYGVAVQPIVPPPHVHQPIAPHVHRPSVYNAYSAYGAPAPFVQHHYPHALRRAYGLGGYGGYGGYKAYGGYGGYKAYGGYGAGFGVAGYGGHGLATVGHREAYRRGFQVAVALIQAELMRAMEEDRLPTTMATLLNVNVNGPIEFDGRVLQIDAPSVVSDADGVVGISSAFGIGVPPPMAPAIGVPPPMETETIGVDPLGDTKEAETFGKAIYYLGYI